MPPEITKKIEEVFSRTHISHEHAQSALRPIALSEIEEIATFCYEQGEKNEFQNMAGRIEAERKAERQKLREKIEARKPNEYGVRKYKTYEARTWDEKHLVIEALDDILSLLQD